MRNLKHFAGLFRFLLAMLVVGFFTSSASACPRCGIFGNRCAFRHVAVQQVVQKHHAYPVTNYFVGAPIRVEAIVEQALRTDPDYEAFQKFRQWQALTEPSANGARLHPGGDLSAASTREDASPPLNTTLAAKCASCHSPPTPKAGLIIDGQTQLTCEQALHAMRRIQAGEMPPKVPLSPEEAGAAFGELLELSKPEVQE